VSWYLPAFVDDAKSRCARGRDRRDPANARTSGSGRPFRTRARLPRRRAYEHRLQDRGRQSRHRLSLSTRQSGRRPSPRSGLIGRRACRPSILPERSPGRSTIGVSGVRRRAEGRRRDASARSRRPRHRVDPGGPVPGGALADGTMAIGKCRSALWRARFFSMQRFRRCCLVPHGLALPSGARGRLARFKCRTSGGRCDRARLGRRRRRACGRAPAVEQRSSCYRGNGLEVRLRPASIWRRYQKARARPGRADGASVLRLLARRGAVADRHRDEHVRPHACRSALSDVLRCNGSRAASGRGARVSRLVTLARLPSGIRRY